uniref:Uncharacterized protein n=1 Tax=Panagrolaimus davidi TaxID=227884 RepID=A0A914PIU9_9BILA
MNLLNSLLKNSNFVSLKEIETLGLKDLAIVSFSSLNHLSEAIRSCDSFQQNPSLNNTPFLIYLSNDVSETVKTLYSELCPIAKIIPLNLSDYPDYVQDLSQYRFKPIYQALSLQKYKVILNVDTSIRFDPNFNFSNLISDVIKQNPTDVTLLASNSHNMFSVTHPKMFECFPHINKKAVNNKIHTIQKRPLILWIGSENGLKIMKKFITCALHPECMGPTGSTTNCDYSLMTKFPNRFSGCHRFDQSAINLILLEESKYRPSLFQIESNFFKIRRDSKLK